MTMTLEVLSRALPFRPEWIFPSHLPRSAVPTTGQYCSHLITGQNVRDLMAALPWNVLTGANIPEPTSFEITVGGFLIERYSAVEFQDLIAYWESTHRFPVPTSLIRSDPYLATFVVERKSRRSHAGARWKQILNLFLIVMREGWCDLDLLLDPYFVHFPKRTDEVAWYPGIETRSANIADPQLNRREPADLIEALAECDAADPWRTHYRPHHAGHPARRIARLAGKFFNMTALNHNAPPLASAMILTLLPTFSSDRLRLSVIHVISFSDLCSRVLFLFVIHPLIHNLPNNTILDPQSKFDLARSMSISESILLHFDPLLTYHQIQNHITSVLRSATSSQIHRLSATLMTNSPVWIPRSRLLIASHRNG
ncbi:hypothetical protein PHMEG_00021642 [Phytophthora megakarya]|uniref:Uncharacterized protein n=1 Tax=Phytophthora megakarya TaxID=4795 RepID=A0A225VKR4_9STRA|nr:hypothetical protein PHMEG_00021642 [Phytophthora megakarya]